MLTGLKPREHCKTDLTPDTYHRTHRPASGACRPVPYPSWARHCLHRTLRRSVRCSRSQRPVSVFSARNTPVTSPNFPTGAIEDMHFIFSRDFIFSLRTHPLSTLQTPPPSQSVPTPQSVYQQVCTCVSIFTIIFFEGVKLSH